MKTKFILVIDKDEESLSLLASRLEVRGYKVSIASKSLQALKIIEQDVPDLIMLDGCMEKLNGLDLAIHIKQNAINAFIPIIMMTRLSNLSLSKTKIREKI